MTLTLHLRPDVTIVAVLLPSEATKPTIKRFEGKRWHVNWLFNDDPNVLGGLCIFYNHLGGKRKYPNHLEPIGLLSSIPEEQAAGLCDKYNEMGSFPCYKIPGIARWTHTGRQCITEAIKANGGDPEQNWLLITTK